MTRCSDTHWQSCLTTSHVAFVSPFFSLLSLTQWVQNFIHRLSLRGSTQPVSADAPKQSSNATGLHCSAVYISYCYSWMNRRQIHSFFNLAKIWWLIICWLACFVQNTNLKLFLFWFAKLSEQFQVHNLYKKHENE